jgi:diguanylate cyclase (GGDEF)-like protein/PAS domain S-box-containing protein
MAQSTGGSDTASREPSRDALRALFDAALDAMLIVDGHARVVEANAAAAHMRREPRDDLIGRTVSELMPPDIATRGVQRWREFLRDGVRVDTTRLLRADGTEIEVEYAATANYLPDRHLWILRDVTERNRAERHAQFQADLLDHVDAAVVAVDSRGNVTTWNAAAERLYGVARAEAIGEPVQTLVVPEGADVLGRQVIERVRRGGTWQGQFTVRRQGREPLPAWVLTAAIPDGSGGLAGYVGVAVDMTERLRAEEQLERNRELLAQRAEQQQAIAELGQRAIGGSELADLMADAVESVARTLRVERVSLLELVPGQGELLVRCTIAGPDGHVRGAQLPADALDAPGLVNVDVRGDTDGGAWGVLSVEAPESRTLTVDEVNFMQSIANVLAGAIERRRVEDAIRHRALHDPLTGLPNRDLFHDRLGHAIAQIERRGRTVAVIFLDIDQFKLVNDSLGHQYGDRLLEAVAPRLRDALRPGDTLARFAGDEFVVLCEGIEDEHGAIAVAERLMAAFTEPFVLGDREQFVSVSMGISLPRRRGGDSADGLIRDADAAMYRAKERGRARYELFDERMRVRTLVRMRVENELRRAVPGEDLHVHYQPIVALANGDLAGFEALIRWRHPRRGDVSPVDFIPIAEESGLIVPIGRWVLEQAAAQGVLWRGHGGVQSEPLTVAVNLSARQLSHGSFADEVATVLNATGLEPERLLLEITESVLMEQTEATLEALHSLKRLGVRLVLDDFGTGYSSLSYLERFPIDALKIDRSFVAGLDSGGSAAIVTAIVSMAHSLDLRVTAEGVETEEQLEQLRRLGCEYAQGFFFGRPGPPAAHERLLGARPPLSGEHP